MLVVKDGPVTHIISAMAGKSGLRVHCGKYGTFDRIGQDVEQVRTIPDRVCSVCATVWAES